MLCRIAKTVLVASLIACLPAVARAQAAARGTVSGTGEVTLRPMPSALRLCMQLQSQGNTVKAALDRLKDRREAAREKLKALGADAELITFGRPTVSKVTPFAPPPSSVPPTFSYPSAIPAPAAGYGPQPYSQPARVYEPPPVRRRRVQVPSLFTASATLTADWPLQAEGMEQVLIASEALKKKIEAADIAGIKDPDELTPEEEEIAEEAAARPGPNAGRPGSYAPAGTSYGTAPAFVPAPVMPSAPRFIYVAKISGQQRKAAWAEAFAKGKTRARELAEAAGTDLGPLVSLHGEICNRTIPDYNYDGPTVYRSSITPGYPALSSYPTTGGGAAEGSSENEAAAVDPGNVGFTCRVYVTFRLP